MTKTDIANLALSKIGESLIDDIDDTGDKRARLASLHYEPCLREILRAHFWGFAMTCPKLEAVPIDVLTITGDLVMGVDETPVVFPELWPVGGETWTSDGESTPPAAGRWYRFLHSSPTWTASVFEDGVEIAFWESLADIASADGIELAASIGVGGTGIVAFTTSTVVLPWVDAWTYPADLLKLRKLQDAEGNKIEHFESRRILGTRRILTRDVLAVRAEYVQFVDDPDEYDPLFTAAFVTLLASRLARAISGSEKAESDLIAMYQNVDLPAARTADGHDSQSNENHPLRELLDGSLTGKRGDFFPEL